MHLENFCSVSNHLLPRNNDQMKQFICHSYHCKVKGREVGIIVMLLRATSFQVVNKSRKVNRTEFPTRKLVLMVFMTTIEHSIIQLFSVSVVFNKAEHNSSNKSAKPKQITRVCYGKRKKHAGHLCGSRVNSQFGKEQLLFGEVIFRIQIF